MTLKEYNKMLTGACINIFTDHKNLTFRTFSIQRILRWKLFIDQFDCKIHYIQGKNNVLADCFSRLPLMQKPTVGDKELQGKGKLIDFDKIILPKDEEEILEGETFTNDNRFYQELRECLLNLPPIEVMDNPITINQTINHQATDIPLQRMIMQG